MDLETAIAQILEDDFLSQLDESDLSCYASAMEVIIREVLSEKEQN